VILGVTAAAFSVTLAACTASNSSSTQSTTGPKASGSATIVVSGKVVAHYTKGCTVGSDGVSNQLTVAFGNVAKVGGVPASLVVYAPKASGSNTYPASSTAAAVRLSNTHYSWANSTGTVTVSDGGAAGTFDLTLTPTPPTGSGPTNQATGSVSVQGSWTGCSVS
jgi:hypothetical protein